MNDLNQTLADIANEFTQRIADAIRGASFGEVAALGAMQSPSPPRHALTFREPRPVSASVVTPQHNVTTDAVYKYLLKHPGGARSQVIKQQFSLDKVQTARLLQKAMSENVVRKTGQKRSTTYFANSEEQETEEITSPAAVLAAKPEPTPQQRVIRRPKKKSSTVVVNHR